VECWTEIAAPRICPIVAPNPGAMRDLRAEIDSTHAAHQGSPFEATAASRPGTIHADRLDTRLRRRAELACFPGRSRHTGAPIVQPPLTDVEARILGSLLEKEVTTPDNYPLSLNALLAACNQTTSREPIMRLARTR
jgi:hypothetical protein